MFEKNPLHYLNLQKKLFMTEKGESKNGKELDALKSIPKAFVFFGRAFKNAKKDFWVSIQVLFWVSMVMSIIFFFVEHEAQPEEYPNWWQAFVWTVTRYIGDPGHFSGNGPVTITGRHIDSIIGILKILIFAVPAGLFANGFRKAMEDDKRRQTLENYRWRMTKAFRRVGDRTLRGYLDSLPDKGGEKYKTLNFVDSRVPISRLQIRQGLDLKDIFDVCNKYHEFRIKNLSEAVSEEQQAEDRFVLECYPINRPYGCCENRNSKVTIVATSCYDESGIGWFTYYLAKLGGFNYVSKVIEVDPDEPDSYYSFSKGPRYDDKLRSAYDVKIDKKAIAVLDKKESNRKVFLEDLKALAPSEDSWVILFTTVIKSSVNTFDYNFVDAKKDGGDSTVHDQQRYQQVFQAFDKMMQSDYRLASSLNTPRYPLRKSNLGYQLKKEGLGCNTFVIRPSCDVVNFDSKNLIYAYRMAMLFSEYFDNGKGIEDEDIKDFKQGGFGYRVND